MALCNHNSWKNLRGTLRMHITGIELRHSRKHKLESSRIRGCIARRIAINQRRVSLPDVYLYLSLADWSLPSSRWHTLDFISQLLSMWFSRPGKSVNKVVESGPILSARPILSFATHEFTTADHKNRTCNLALFFLHLMSEDKCYRITNKIDN